MHCIKSYFLFASFVVATFTTTVCSAEDVYYVKSLKELNFVGKKPDLDLYSSWRWAQSTPPHIVIEGAGEAHVAWIGPNPSRWGAVAVRANGDANKDANEDANKERKALIQARFPVPEGVYVAIRLPASRKVEGRLILSTNSDKQKQDVFRFSISDDEKNAVHPQRFLWVKRAHYLELLNKDIPGAAWFRYQATAIGEELEIQSRATRRGQNRRFFGTRRSANLEDTFALISGGRAVSENLQLDRALPDSAVAQETVLLSSLPGITVREFDWKPLVQDIDPKLDALAELVPDDQHALFFPSFTALIAMADSAQKQSVPILSFAEPKSESAGTRQRYERQLCLSLTNAAKLLGPAMIESVAMTGGDPYLRTGSDVAILFQAKKDSQMLQQAILAQVVLMASMEPASQTVEGKIGNVTYVGRRSPSRSVCSYVATVGDSVIVTNSLAQLERIVQTAEDRNSSLAALDEYRFFRDRYPLDDQKESALLIISDKTIRRWCGPKWRIGTSRRTRALAHMTQIQAENLDGLVGGKITAKEIGPRKLLPDAGKFLVSASGVRSSVYGSLDFQTPILELDFDHVTQQEAQFYERWRNGYQNNWSNFFDPIAVRLFVEKRKVAMDLTVMPLIDSSVYSGMVNFSSGAKINPDARDPHAETIVQSTFSINTKTLAQEYGGLAQGLLRIDPFSWVGETLSWYIDKDPFWAQLAAAENKEEFAERHLHEFPIAMNVEVKNALKLVGFLTAARAYIEQVLPGILEWKTLQYNEHAYVRVGLTQQGQQMSGDEFGKLAIFYGTNGRSLTVTLNENIIRRSLDRQIARSIARNSDEKQEKTNVQRVRPLLGENFCVQVDPLLLKLLAAGFSQQYQDAMQRRAWSNLPILNEWKRHYPKKNPVSLHQDFWQRQLLCPGGGQYRWNEEWQTMESTVYGHSGQAKKGPDLPSSLRNLLYGNFGISFEENGLRARVELEQDAKDRLNR